MALVSAKEMLQKAKAGHYAVGQFNINNLEWTKAILLTAQELNSPVILGVSEGAGKYMGGYKTIVGMVNGMLEELNITVPVALHLDHGTYDGCLKCVAAGFSSIMFDGSHYPIDENVQKTTELVKIAHEGLRMPGAMCGLWGICGAIASVGAALSIIDGTGPLSDDGTWGEHMKFTSQAISELGRINGPRCCKRDAMIAFREGIRYINEHYGVVLEYEDQRCEFSERNQQCLRERCPFFGAEG